MRLHVVRKMGGGYGTFLRNLAERGEEVWEIESQEIPIHPHRVTRLVLYGYIPNFPFKDFSNSKNFYYFHGLRAVSRRMLSKNAEYNPIHILKLRAFRKWLENFHEFISVSFSMREMARRFYGVDSVVVHNGINLKNLKSCRNEAGDYLLWIGRDAWIKGIDDFLRLVKMLSDIPAVVVGRVRLAKVPYGVRLVGYVSDIGEIICGARAIVITSRFEAFSYVTLEGLILGKPVLVLRRAGGAWEILQMLGLYKWGFDTVEDLAEFLKGNPDLSFPFELDLSLFSFDITYRKLMEVLK